LGEYRDPSEILEGNEAERPGVFFVGHTVISWVGLLLLSGENGGVVGVGAENGVKAGEENEGAVFTREFIERLPACTTAGVGG